MDFVKSLRKKEVKGIRIEMARRECDMGRGVNEMNMFDKVYKEDTSRLWNLRPEVCRRKNKIIG